MVETQDWQADIVRLKREDLSRTSADIAVLVGKHAGTVRKVLKRATEGEMSSNGNGNGNGNGHGAVDAETAERLRQAAGISGDPIPGQTTVADFIEEAGEAVGPMPPKPPAREMDMGEANYVEEIRVDGTTQLALDCGGKAADEATLTLSGSAIVLGYFRKGDVIEGTFKARVDGVSVKDTFDKKTGALKATDQKHAATITAISVVPW